MADVGGQWPERTRIQSLIEKHGSDPRVIFEAVRGIGKDLTPDDKEELKDTTLDKWAPGEISNHKKLREWKIAGSELAKLTELYGNDKRFSELAASIDQDKAVYEGYRALCGECMGDNPSRAKLREVTRLVGELRVALTSASSGGPIRDNASSEAGTVEKWLNTPEVIKAITDKTPETPTGIACPKLASTDALFIVKSPEQKAK